MICESCYAPKSECVCTPRRKDRLISVVCEEHLDIVLWFYRKIMKMKNLYSKVCSKTMQKTELCELCFSPWPVHQVVMKVLVV